MKKRTRFFNDFKKSKISILCTCKILQEGIDIKCIDAVCFVDPKNSIIDIVQSIGRCLRQDKGKKKSYVIIPTLFDDNEENMNKAFQSIWNVIKGMTQTDTDLIEYFKACHYGKVWKGSNKYKKDCILDDVKVGISIKIEKWIDMIESKMYDKTDHFDILCTKLEAYVEQNKKLPSSSSKDKEESIIGVFCTKLRKKYNENNLSKERIDRINKNIKIWYWEKDKFQIKYEELVAYIDINGALPKRRSKNKEEKSLAEWIKGKKDEYKNKKLSKERIDLLNLLPLWQWGLEDIFDNKCLELSIFVKEYGKLPSSKNKIDKYRLLGIWCQHQRTKFKQGKLTEDQIEKLNEIDYWYFPKEENKDKIKIV